MIKSKENQDEKPCLQTSSAKLFNSNIDFLTMIFCTTDHAFKYAAKSTLSNHKGTAKTLCGCLQLRECEHSQIIGFLRQTCKRIPSWWFCADFLRIEFRARSPHVMVSRRGSIRADGNRLCSFWFFILSFGERKTLHSKSMFVSCIE